MPDFTEVNLFKAVNTSRHTVRRGRQVITATRSALLNRSRLMVDYGVTLDKGAQLHYVSAVDPNCPIVCFSDAKDAFTFIANRHGRKVYRLHGFATLVKPVKRVLKLNLGWEKQAVEFWNAVREDLDLAAFDTRAAPTGSVAMWGVFRLTELLPAMPVEQAELAEVKLPLAGEAEPLPEADENDD